MRTSTSTDPIRIILADDHFVVRAGLKALLSGEPDIELVGEAVNGREALALIDRVHPEVAVLDLDMPVMDGLTALRTVVASQAPTRVLILTMHEEDEYLATLLAAGAAGYLTKSVADRELTVAIRTVASGATYVHSTSGRPLSSPRPPGWPSDPRRQESPDFPHVAIATGTSP